MRLSATDSAISRSRRARSLRRVRQLHFSRVDVERRPPKKCGVGGNAARDDGVRGARGRGSHASKDPPPPPPRCMLKMLLAVALRPSIWFSEEVNSPVPLRAAEAAGAAALRGSVGCWPGDPGEGWERQGATSRGRLREGE